MALLLWINGHIRKRIEINVSKYLFSIGLQREIMFDVNASNVDNE
jgi:hypothetical protein